MRARDCRDGGRTTASSRTPRGQRLWHTAVWLGCSATACQATLNLDDYAFTPAEEGPTDAGSESEAADDASTGSTPEAGPDRDAGGGRNDVCTEQRLGCRCDVEAALACNGTAQKTRLICQGGVWANNGPCDAEENCDSTTGTCRTVLAECAGQPAGRLACIAGSVSSCGADEVTADVVEACLVHCEQASSEPRCVSATQVSTRGDHTCVLLSTGGVRCFGRNDTGQLGYGNTINVGDGIGPEVVDQADVSFGLDVRATQIALGGTHSCAILSTGDLRCWGSDEFGQLGYAVLGAIGDGTGPDVGDVPQRDFGVGVAAIEVSTPDAAGDSAGTCVRLSTDEAPAAFGPLQLFPERGRRHL